MKTRLDIASNDKLFPAYESTLFNEGVTYSLLLLINLWPSDSISNWKLEVLVFEERGKPENLETKTSRSKDENQQQTQLHMTPSPGIEPEPCWWEASALTSAPSLHSPKSINLSSVQTQ